MPVLINKFIQSAAAPDDREYEFLTMTGRIYYSQAQIQTVSRIGLQGVELRNIGVKPKPFRLVTVNFMNSFDVADDLLRVYIEELKTGPSILIQRNGDLVGDGALFNVLDIQEAQNPQSTSQVCADLPELPSSTAAVKLPTNDPKTRQVLQWTLIAR